MKKVKILIALWLINLLFSAIILGKTTPYPMMYFSFDDKLENVDLRPFEEDAKREEIMNGLREAYKEMWEDFKNIGDKVLPYCIFDAINALKNNPKLDFIEFTFTLGGQSTIPPGDSWDGDLLGFYAGLPDKKLPREGIWIWGVWKKLFESGVGGKIHCLKAVIFHEILHFAIDFAVRNETGVKNEFSINFKQNSIIMIPVFVNGTWIVIKPKTELS